MRPLACLRSPRTASTRRRPRRSPPACPRPACPPPACPVPAKRQPARVGPAGPGTYLPKRRRCSSPPSVIRRLSGPLSIGTPDAGLLLNPVPFPEGPFWTVRDPSESWGTDETIAFIVTAIEAVEARYPGSPRLVIGDLSHPRGGRLNRHRSHQAGRDADVGFYYRRGDVGSFLARAEEGPRPAAHVGPRPGARHRDGRRSDLRRPLAHLGAVRPRRRRGRGPRLAGRRLRPHEREGHHPARAPAQGPHARPLLQPAGAGARTDRLPGARRDGRGPAAHGEAPRAPGRDARVAGAALRDERLRDPRRERAPDLAPAGRAQLHHPDPPHAAGTRDRSWSRCADCRRR